MHEKVLSILDADYRQWIVSLKKRYRHDETRGEMGSGLLWHAYQGSSAIASGCEGILLSEPPLYASIL